MNEKLKKLENAVLLMGSQLEWIEMILEGKDISDFAMSFDIVRRVMEMKIELEHYRARNEDLH